MTVEKLEELVAKYTASLDGLKSKSAALRNRIDQYDRRYTDLVNSMTLAYETYSADETKDSYDSYAVIYFELVNVKAVRDAIVSDLKMNVAERRECRRLLGRFSSMLRQVKSQETQHQTEDPVNGTAQ